MTADGIGTITVDCKLSQVRVVASSAINLIDTILQVLYRSKDSTLPDFSQEKGPGGEVFFDVRTSLYSGHLYCIELFLRPS